MFLGWTVCWHVGWGVRGWGGVSGFGGGWEGCNNVLSTNFLMVFVILQHPTSNIQHALDATLWHFFLQHLTRSWCYAVTLLLATSNTLLMLRCGTSSCNIQHALDATLWHFFLEHPSEHKELRSASAASESCFQRVLGWCRIFLGSSQRSESEVETREAHRFCRWLPGAARSSWSCQDSKFERCFPSPLRIYAAGHPPQKRYDPRLCDTATQTGARWDGKRKERQFHIGSWWQCGWRFGKCIKRTAETGWVSCQPLHVTRSSTAISCARTTWTRSLAWNAFFELLPYIGKKRQMDYITSPSQCFQKPLELVTAVKSAKKGDYQLLGRCGKHRLYWYLQWILMDLHFPWRSQGFCIIILMTMYGHLIKSATLPRNLLLPFCKTNTFC